MKKLTRVLIMLGMASALTLTTLGCHPATSSTTPPAALAPGALNQFDQQTYQALTTAHAFALSAASNDQTLTRAQKQALNQFISALNAADMLYAAYHAGTATQEAMQAAQTSVTTQETSFSTTVTSQTGNSPQEEN